MSALQKVYSLENVDKAQLLVIFLKNVSLFLRKSENLETWVPFTLSVFIFDAISVGEKYYSDLLCDLRRITRKIQIIYRAQDFLIDPCIYRAGKSWFILGCGKAKMPYQVTMKYNFLQQGVIKQHRPTAALMKAFSIHLSADKEIYWEMDPRRGSFETLVPVVASKQETNIPFKNMNKREMLT